MRLNYDINSGSLDDYNISNINQKKMMNLLNQRNQRLKEENVRLNLKINNISRQNKKY